MRNLSALLHISYNKDRIYGLDILRAVAICFVVLLHSAYLLPGRVAAILECFILDGVSLFFVLSGFLIGGILIRILEQGNLTFKALLHFWIKRWLRTLPAYYVVLVLLILLPATYTGFTSWSETGGYFLFIQNFNKPHPYFFMEAWSLSLEEWFYLLIPVMIFFLIIARLHVRSAIIATTLIVVAGSIAYRYCLFVHLPVITTREWELVFKKQVVTRFDSIMIGVIGAYGSYYHRLFWTKYKIHFLIAGSLTLLSMKIAIELKSPGSWFFLCIFYFTVNALGALLLLPYLSELKRGGGILYRIITYISLISYSMYLLNFSFIEGFVLRHIDFYTYTGIFLVLRYILFWAFTVGGATILYRCIERPFMSLRSIRTTVTEVK